MEDQRNVHEINYTPEELHDLVNSLDRQLIGLREEINDKNEAIKFYTEKVKKLNSNLFNSDKVDELHAYELKVYQDRIVVLNDDIDTLQRKAIQDSVNLGWYEIIVNRQKKEIDTLNEQVKLCQERNKNQFEIITRLQDMVNLDTNGLVRLNLDNQSE